MQDSQQEHAWRERWPIPLVIFPVVGLVSHEAHSTAIGFRIGACLPPLDRTTVAAGQHGKQVPRRPGGLPYSTRPESDGNWLIVSAPDSKRGSRRKWDGMMEGAESLVDRPVYIGTWPTYKSPP